MSDNIDIPVHASGEDGINRVVSALERMEAALGRLGTAGASGLGQLDRRLQEMQASMTTGFAELAVLSKKSMGSLGDTQAAQAKANGEKVAKATEAAGLKIKEADARTWEQIQRGSAANISRAFNMLAQGVPVEAVQKRLGNLATTTASSFGGQLEQLKQFQANTKSLWQTHYSTLAGATEAQIGLAQKMNQAWDEKMRTRSASKIDARTLLGLPTESEARSAGRQIAAQMRAAVDQENLRAKSAGKVDARSMLGLPSESEMQSFSARMKAHLQEQVAAEKSAAAEIRRLHADTERQRVLNTQFQTASPTAQIRMATQARTYADLGGNAAQRYGSAAASADIRALQAAHDRLRPSIDNTRQSMLNHNQAMRDAHGLARGLAGSLGGLWLTYGSAVPLLAGAAVATSLKKIVEVGAEVEQQLNFVFALSGQTVNLDKFLTITDSSLNSVSEAANAMRMLAQNGLDAGQSLQVLPSVLALATVGEMQVGQAALAATGAVSAFGLSFTEAGRVADVFAKVAATSNTSVLAMTESMKQASTVASLFKVSLEETAGMLGLLAKINITGGAAGTSMTNMLTGLYEPTNQGKRALKELGVETQTATGALKPLTQTLEEIKRALARFNDSAKVDFLGDIFTVRGVKSALLAIDNLDEFKKKTDEARTATGFMRSVVEDLENSTKGAFQRLGATVSNTFTKAFTEASPYVQQLGITLTKAFGDEQTKTTLGNLAGNVARLTGALVENAGAVAALGAAYLVWRSLGPVIRLIDMAVIATNAATTANVAATTAQRALTASHLAGVASNTLLTASVEANTAATVAATAAATAWRAVMLPALGAIGVAVGAGAALWLLFRDNTTEAETANIKMSNTLDVIADNLAKEEERLKKVIALWDERRQVMRDATDPTLEERSAAEFTVQSLRKQARDKGLSPEDLKRLVQTNVSAGSGMYAGSGMRARSPNERLAYDLMEAERNLKRLDDLEKRAKGVTADRVKETLINRSNNLSKSLKEFSDQATQKDTKGIYYYSDALREVFARAKDLESLRVTRVLKDPEKEAERLGQIETSFKRLRDEANKLQTSRAEKASRDPAAARLANQELNADLKRLDLQRQLAQMESQSNIAAARAGNRRGELGDLELINVELAEKLKLRQQEVDVARQQFERTALADPSRPAKEQEYLNRKTLAERAAQDDTRAAEEARSSALARMAQEEQKYSAETLAAQGKHKEAFLSQYEADYRTTINRITADMEAAEARMFETSVDDAAHTQAEIEYNQLQSYLKHLGRLRETGVQANIFKEMSEQFDNMFEGMAQRLEAFENIGEEAGLGAMFIRAQAAAKEYQQTLPRLLEQQKALEQQAKTGTPDQQKTASAALRKIQQEAAIARNVWVDFSKVVGDSLEKAFGRGGRAMGDLMTGLLALDARQQEINAAYEASGKTYDDRIQREQDATSAAIRGYGQMAQASAGFFDEESRGYQALTAMSKVFHMAEAAAAAAKLVPMAIAAVLNQGSGDPYTAFGRMAAMAAIVTGLGVAIGGAGGSKAPSAADVQKSQGTGTVLGDVDAKSASIANSLERVSNNTYQGLAVSQNMLRALRSIESSMSGLGNLVAAVPELVGGKASGQALGQINIGKPTDLISRVMTNVTQGVFGFGLGDKIAGFINNLWGKTKKEVADSGLTFGGSLDALQSGQGFSQYTSINTTKSSFFGLSKKTTGSTQTSALDGDIASQFGLIFTNLEATLRVAAEQVGVGADSVSSALDKLVLESTTLSLKDLKGEDLTAAISAVLSKAMDEMSAAVFPTLGQFRQVGEGYAETVVRLATEYQTIDVVFQSFGKTFGQVGLASIEARTRLVELAGGLDAFTEQGAYFLENFFSESEQSAKLRERISPTLAKFGLSADGDQAKQMFRDFVLALDTTTAAGAEAYSTLMSLAPAFQKTVEVMARVADERQNLEIRLMELQGNAAGALAAQRARELAALDASLRPLQERIYALEDEAAAVERIHSQANELMGTVDSALSLVQKVAERERTALQKKHDAEMKAIDARIAREEQAVEKSKSLAELLKAAVDEAMPMSRTGAQDQLRAVLAQVRAGGSLPDAESLRPVVAALRQEDTDSFASLEDYLRDQYRTANDLASLGGTATTAQTIAEAQLEATRTMRDRLVEAHEAELARLDAILENAEQQVEALKFGNELTISLTEALLRLTAALGAAKGNPVVAATPAITEAYQSYLGRAPEAAGLKYYQDEAAKGTPLDTLINNIKTSPEAQIVNLYKQLLGRAPEAGGVEFYMDALRNGTSLETIAQNFKDSPEYRLRGFDVGTNYVPYDMPAMIHEGERIIPAADNRQLMAFVAAGTSAPAADTRALEVKVEQLTRVVETHLYAIAKNTRDAADYMGDSVNGGVPFTVKVVPE